MQHHIRKAIFPVAGMGTRFLPATKANPKEMLPIVDKPLIQYAVEEAIAAGLTEMIFVTSSSKRSIEDHFDSNFELEHQLKTQQQHERLALVRDILPRGVSCVYVRQSEPLGLGHAVLQAKQIVGNEPFAVLLADDLIIGKPEPCLKQMIDIYEKHHHSIMAVESVIPENVSKYGIVAVEKNWKGLGTIQHIVEKPTPAEAPSNLAAIGRYILPARIFEILAHQQKGKGNEIQLTDAIAELLKEEIVQAFQFQGKRYDCGSKLGYLQATITYALTHPEIGEDFKQYLTEFAKSVVL